MRGFTELGSQPAMDTAKLHTHNEWDQSWSCKTAPKPSVLAQQRLTKRTAVTTGTSEKGGIFVIKESFKITIFLKVKNISYC